MRSSCNDFLIPFNSLTSVSFRKFTQKYDKQQERTHGSQSTPLLPRHLSRHIHHLGRLLLHPHQRGFHAVEHLCRGHPLHRARTQEKRQSVQPRGKCAQHHAHALDIHSCRSVCQRCQDYWRGRRHCKSHAVGSSRQSCIARTLSCHLLHKPLHRHKRWHHRSFGAYRRRPGSVHRYERCSHDCRRGGRSVLRRQPLVHLRHNHCRHQHSGLQHEG